jgi:hypothetical protein
MDGGSYLIRFSGKCYGLSYVRTGVLNRHPRNVPYNRTGSVRTRTVRVTVQPYTLANRGIAA